MPSSESLNNKALSVYTAKLLGALLAGFLLLKAPFMGPVLDGFCLLLAKLTAGLLSIFDPEVQRQGIAYYRHNWGNAIAVTRECGAFELSLVAGSAILLLKRPLRWRLKALVSCLLLIQALNIVRLVTLLYGRILLPRDAFDTFHYQLLPFLLGLYTVVLLALALQGQGPFRISRSSDDQA